MKHDRVQICLASASPRRSELLKQIGVRFKVQAANIDETPLTGELAEQFVQRMALSKAKAVQQAPQPYTQPEKTPLPVLGADTIVLVGEHILGKPGCRDEAFAMWRQLSASTHQVLTAVALVDQECSDVICNRSEVSFRAIDENEMEQYWRSGEPTDKAGGYAIQGMGAVFVSRLEGSYSAVMGLPLYETDQLLRRFGLTCGLKCWQG